MHKVLQELIEREDMDDKTRSRIEIECMRGILIDTFPLLYSLNIHITDEDIKEYIRLIQYDDKQNHLILALRKAVRLTEEALIRDIKEQKMQDESGQR